MNFNQKAEIYEKISISQKQAADKLLSFMDIKNKDNVIDVGCGSGYLTEQISRVTNSVAGFDNAENMILEAKKLRPHLNFFVEDADFFCIKEAYDWIITNAVTYYFKNLYNTLNNFHTSLKYGGRYALQAQTQVTPQFINAMSGLLKDSFTAVFYSKFKLPINQLTLNEFIILLEKIGFKIERAELINFQTEYTFEEAINIFKSGTATPFLNPVGYGTDLPQRYINQFWETVEKGIKAQCTNNKIVLDVPRCFIIAGK